MNRELDALIGHWLNTLLDAVAAFRTVSDDVADRAAHRANGLSTVADIWSQWGLVSPIDYELPQRDDRHAITRVRRATADLMDVSSRATRFLSSWSPGNTLEKRVHTNLLRRQRNLEGLIAEAEAEGWRAFYTQMNAVVPASYACTVLRESFQYRPHASPRAALAVMALHAACIPADYAAAVLPMWDFDEDDAETVIRLYNERIPSELGAALL